MEVVKAELNSAVAAAVAMSYYLLILFIMSDSI